MSALAVLAHQGGWDEVLLPIVAVLLVIGLGIRRRRVTDESEDGPAESADEACAYCGAALEPEDERCPKCGFARA